MRCMCPDWSRPVVGLSTSQAPPRSRNSRVALHGVICSVHLTPAARLGAQVGNLLLEDHRLVTNCCHFCSVIPRPID